MFFRVLSLTLGIWLLSPSADATCNHLKVSGTVEYPPYMWQVDGRFEGAVAEMLRYISGEKSGLTLELVYTGSWGRTQIELEAHNLDMLAGIFYNEQRAVIMDYIQPPITQSNARIWVNPKAESMSKINSLEQLQGLQGASVIGFSLGKTFDEYAEKHLKLHRLRSIRQGFKMLADQRIDYIAYEEQPGIAILNTMGIADLTMLPFIVSTEGIYLGISKISECNTQEIKEKISRAIKAMQEKKLMQGFINNAQKLWQENSYTAVKEQYFLY